jgi:hypothetical protein
MMERDAGTMVYRTRVPRSVRRLTLARCSGSPGQQIGGLLVDWNAVQTLVQILCSAPW